jgi:Holliday junction resolvase-like predicted endonuclease
MRGPRQQGAAGEFSAMLWLAQSGYDVYLPLGHSADIDLIAVRGSEVLRVQVKTSRVLHNDRWCVTLATRGGNRSWNGLVKRFSADRCDALFVAVADGRRWFVPAAEVGGSGMLLGGPKYEAFEVESGPPLASLAGEQPLSLDAPWRGSRAVKGGGL